MAAASKEIVVGIDGSEPSRTALAWALDEARLRSAKLIVVHAWTFPPAVAGGPFGGYASVFPAAPATAEGVARDAEQILQDEVSAVATGTGVEIELHADEGQPASTLIERARDADLLVVGTRGHGGFTGLLLGSVSATLAHHAPCPLAIVRQPEPA